MDKIFIFLGPPGCGKGTQTTKLAAALNVPHIDTGSLLRGHINSQSEYGKEAQLYINKGQLVPTRIVQDVIKTRLLEDDAKNGYVLDGFPRSIEQAKALEVIREELKEKKELAVLYFNVPTEVLVERLINRRSCPACGMIYNIVTAPPKIENHCDVCKVKLIQRADDNRETALKRFETYHSKTAPLLEYYQNKGSLKEIEANQSIDQVWKQVKKIALKEEIS